MNSSKEVMPEILAESRQWLVISKPSGWLTVPGRSEVEYPVLSDWLRGKGLPVWVVHRLDRETSGVILFARTSEDHLLANTWFQKRKMKKVYFCLAAGSPKAPLLKVTQPIEGAPSITQVEVKERYHEGFLARVTPGTGRRHQIRIHLSQSGYPLWGDPLYGGAREVTLGEEQLTVPRVALHASLLELPTGEKFESPFPDDFGFWLEQLRKQGRRV
jgi:23S rRNA-/tRNA-specific pseudouridylate synthase